jgi:hypothetical protein
VLLIDKQISPLEVLTAVREEISKTDYDPFYLTVLGPQFECALGTDLRIAREVLTRCLLTVYHNNEVFIYDTVVVNLSHFSLLMLKLE